MSDLKIKRMYAECASDYRGAAHFLYDFHIGGDIIYTGPVAASDNRFTLCNTDELTLSVLRKAVQSEFPSASFEYDGASTTIDMDNADRVKLEMMVEHV